MSDELRREITLVCPPERAFRAFTDHVDLWWPRGHRKGNGGTLRFSRDALVHTASDGVEWTMAKVRVFLPPDRLELDWFPGSPMAPTNVDIAFEPHGDGTRITIVHRPLSPAAADVWPQRVATFAAGWDAVLADLEHHITTGEPNG